MSKRKLTSYTVEEKLQAVSRYRNGERQCTLVRELGVPEGTLRGWIRNEANLRSFVDDTDSPQSLKRKKTNNGKDPALDRAVFDWFVTQRSDGVPLSGALVRTQALQMSQQLHPDAPGDSFEASKGWLARWQRRHGIRAVKIAGEARSADVIRGLGPLWA